MQEFFHKAQSGDEIFFLPNVFLLEEDNNNIIRKMSNKTSILYEHIMIRNKNNNNTWSFYIKDYDNKGSSLLYTDIRKIAFRDDNLKTCIHGGSSYLSLIQINGEVKVFKYGTKIMNMLIDNYDKDILGAECNKFIINIKLIDDFPNYDGCFFTREKFPIMFPKQEDYIKHIENTGIKNFVNNYINQNLITKNYSKLKLALKEYKLDHLMRKPEFIALERLEKFKELNIEGE